MRRMIKKTAVVLLLAASLSGCGHLQKSLIAPVESSSAESVQSEPILSTEPEIILPTSTPSPEPIPTEEPTPPETARPEITPGPSPKVNINYSVGAIPYSLSEGTNLWRHIDSSDSTYWSVADTINAMRSAAGLPGLTVDAGLSAIADNRCEQIVLTDNFSHEGMCAAAEILGQNYDSAGTVCTAWQNSHSHYAAIVNPGYTRMASPAGS